MCLKRNQWTNPLTFKLQIKLEIQEMDGLHALTPSVYSAIQYNNLAKNTSPSCRYSLGYFAQLFKKIIGVEFFSSRLTYKKKGGLKEHLVIYSSRLSSSNLHSHPLISSGHCRKSAVALHEAYPVLRFTLVKYQFHFWLPFTAYSSHHSLQINICVIQTRRWMDVL